MLSQCQNSQNHSYNRCTLRVLGGLLNEQYLLVYLMHSNTFLLINSIIISI